MVDNVQESSIRHGSSRSRWRAITAANWILLDYGDIIIHVFDEENRLFYDLERIWRDGSVITAEDLEA